jgi:hypothetical protein
MARPNPDSAFAWNQRLTEAHGKAIQSIAPCQTHVPHLVPDWCVEVAEDAEPVEFDPTKLSFHGFLEDGEFYVTGEVMRARGKERNIGLGLSDVPRLLGKDGKGLTTIPEELCDTAYIVLSKTVLRGRHGDLCVPFLAWDGDRWSLLFLRLDDHWFGHDRLVSCE